MKVKNLIPRPHLDQSHGLTFKEMRNLKQVVAVFGVNGSGKSRLLSYLQEEIDPKINKLLGINNSINNYESRINNLSDLDNERLKLDIRYRDEILIDFECENGDSLINLTGEKLSIQEYENMKDNEYRSISLNLVDYPDFKQVKQNCAKLIKSLCKSEISQAYHDKVKGKTYFSVHEEIQKKNIDVLHLLKEAVMAIMNKTLEYSTDEHLTPILRLNDRVLRLNELSNGERELLAYCTYLAIQSQPNAEGNKATLKNKIVIIDEPELFLHPKAQIDLINGLRKLVGPNGQIWIATHSLTILSILDRDEIWLMENGNVISPSIETPNKVLTSLIGEGNLDALENFLSSQYEWASIQFALECLFPPDIIPHKKEDAQQNQVTERLLASAKPVKILDFGAGKGRIAQEILRNENLAPKIYYQALEIDKDLHSQLGDLSSQLQKISTINPDIEREVLDTHEKLAEKQYNSYFDYILMVNVLHEIPINKWSSILSSLLNSLNEDGHLIILEDQALPRGENAHEFGFIIFNEQEVKILFSLENLPISFKHIDSKYSERLTCIEIPKQASKVTEESINEALKRKKSNCKLAINQLRNKKIKTPKDGRTNSFLTQLYANVVMALGERNKLD